MNIQWQGILGESTVRLPGVSEFALGNKFWWWCYQVWGSHLFRFGSCWWPCKSKTCHWPRAPCNTSCGSWCTTLDPWMTGSSNGNRIFTTWWVSLWRCGRLPSIWSSCWILWCFWLSDKSSANRFVWFSPVLSKYPSSFFSFPAFLV